MILFMVESYAAPDTNVKLPIASTLPEDDGQVVGRHLNHLVDVQTMLGCERNDSGQITQAPVRVALL